MLTINELKEKIYFPKTREYFIEVEKSFYDGNYRSATVMLYSVIIADILYKLEELRDIYQDGVAKDILKNINRERAENKSNSEWEMLLLKEVKGRTEIIEDITFVNLEYLKKLRNFSAHPAFDKNNELIAPTRETIAGLIEEMLKQILVRPPIFASKITDLISSDIAEKKWIFLEDEEEFNTYLNNKYLNRTEIKMKMQIFKAFWKFVLKLDNDDCNTNRDINFEFLKIIIKNNKLACIEEISKENQYYNQISNNVDINEYLVKLMYDFPEIYELLESSTKTTLDLAFREKSYLNIIAYYRYTSVDEFLINLKSNQLTRFKYIKMLESYIFEQKKNNVLYDKYIELLKGSSSFDESDRLFSYTIERNVERFSKEQVIALIQAINENAQLYNRNRAYRDNNIIIEKCANVLEITFDYKQYENFKFSQELLDKVTLPF